MVRLLNRKLGFVFVFILSVVFINAQTQDEPNLKDYKDPEQFEKFRKKRKVVAAWQINQLKQGALVVRLKTNKKLIDALIQRGEDRLAEEKRLEQRAINLNTMRAYILNYTFSKVYFIYSHSSDSLLNGSRTNIFVDTTLAVNKAIEMKEKYYLLAERDYVYKSSIGFVPEDSAKIQVQHGNSVKDVPIVIKNKYGHQLIGPFPYYVGEKFNQQKKLGYLVYINIEGIAIPFNIGGSKSSRAQKSFNYKGKELTLTIPKHYTYQKIAASVERLNENLLQFYQGSPNIERDKIAPDFLKFLY